MGEEQVLSITTLCRRNSYETIINQRSYCTVEEDCIYKADKSDQYGYRCMNLEKKELWKYQLKTDELEVLIEE